MHESLLPDVKLSVDEIKNNGKSSYIKGWCFSTSVEHPVKEVRIKQNETHALAKYGLERSDVEKHYELILPLSIEDIEVSKKIRNYYRASGFQIQLPKDFKKEGDIFLEILKSENWEKVYKFCPTESNNIIENEAVAKNLFKMSETVTPNLVIFDNVYENPDAVREFALNCTFQANKKYHRGARTTERFLPEGLKDRIEKLMHKKISKWEEHGINGVFQYCTAEENLVYHCDTQDWAGMIYLTPDAPPSCGTTTYKSRRTGLRMSPTKEDEKRLGKGGDTLHYEIFKNNFFDKTDLDVVDVAGNVYNRLVIFNARAIHSASEYFGDTKENGRLFQLLFFDLEK